MATLAQSAVTANEVWYTGRNRKFKCVDATLALTGQGGSTNTILAVLFGLSKITEVRAARDSSDNPVNGRPSYDGTAVRLDVRAAPTAGTYVVTGVDSTGGAADITATGAAATDVVESVIDLTTPAKLVSSRFTPGTNKFTQAVAAGDLSAKKLLITTRSAPTSTPTDVTATVRLIVVGTE